MYSPIKCCYVWTSTYHYMADRRRRGQSTYIVIRGNILHYILSGQFNHEYSHSVVKKRNGIDVRYFMNFFQLWFIFLIYINIICRIRLYAWELLMSHKHTILF